MSEFTLKDNSEQVMNQIDAGIERALEAIGIIAEGYAALELENDPRRIDTGNLRNSISHTVAGEGAERAAYIGTNVEYGIYVHEGTVRMRPNRFLKNAAERHKDEYEQIIKDSLP